MNKLRKFNVAYEYIENPESEAKMTAAFSMIFEEIEKILKEELIGKVYGKKQLQNA